MTTDNDNRFNVFRVQEGRWYWIEARHSLADAERSAEYARKFYGRHGVPVRHVIGEMAGQVVRYHELSGAIGDD